MSRACLPPARPLRTAVSTANGSPITSVVTDQVPTGMASTVTDGVEDTSCQWMLDMESSMDSRPKNDISVFDVLLSFMRTCCAGHRNEQGCSILSGGHKRLKTAALCPQWYADPVSR